MNQRLMLMSPDKEEPDLNQETRVWLGESGDFTETQWGWRAELGG